jgi:hypothetical protein
MFENLCLSKNFKVFITILVLLKKQKRQYCHKDFIKKYIYLLFLEKKIVLKSEKNLELRGIDPLTFRMQSGRSTTELQPLVKCLIIFLNHIIQKIKCLNQHFLFFVCLFLEIVAHITFITF